MFVNAITSPLASLLLLVLGSQFMQIFISVALVHAGFSETAAGFVHSSFYGGLLVSALYCEGIIHRVGHIRAFTTFACIYTSTIIIQAFYVNLELWIVMRFLAGFALAGLYVTIESWLLTDSTELNRGTRLAIYMVTLYIAQSISPQIFNLIDTKTLQPYLIAALFCAMSSIPVSLTRKLGPVMPERLPLKIPSIYSQSPYGFIGCVVSGLIISALYSFLPNYAMEYGIPVSLIMSVLITGGFLLQWPLGKLSDKVPRKKMLSILSLICVLPSLLAMMSGSHLLTYVMAFCIGGMSFVLYPISIALVCDKVDNRNILQATGVLLFSYGIGSVLGPVIVASIIKAFGSILVLFAFVACVSCVYGLLGLYQISLGRKRLSRRHSESVDFIPLPRQSPIANQLDPRVESEELDLVQDSKNDDNTKPHETDETQGEDKTTYKS